MQKNTRVFSLPSIFIRYCLAFSVRFKFSFSGFTPELWCNTVENQLGYIYNAGKLRCCCFPTNSFFTCKTLQAWYPFKVSSDCASLLCLSEAVCKPLIFAVLVFWIFFLVLLLPDYIQFFQHGIWCFLAKTRQQHKTFGT